MTLDPRSIYKQLTSRLCLDDSTLELVCSVLRQSLDAQDSPQSSMVSEKQIADPLWFSRNSQDRIPSSLPSGRRSPQAQTLFIPMHHGDCWHWTLCVLSRSADTIDGIVLDSLRDDSRGEIVKSRLRQWASSQQRWPNNVVFHPWVSST
jgi:hypothetical protein